jgi:hypothetical protein
MMRAAQANDETTGTVLFSEDDPWGYLKRLVNFDEVEFVIPASDFEPKEIMQKHLGGPL